MRDAVTVESVRALSLRGKGAAVSAVVGYLAIRFFIRYVVDHSLRAFAYYRFALAAVVAALLVLL